MSFLSYFKQEPSIVKPWKCRNSAKAFTQRAHAANHQKQTKSLACRAMGFEHVERRSASQVRVTPPPLEHKYAEPVTMEECGFEESKDLVENLQDVLPLEEPDETGRLSNHESSDDVLQFGSDVDFVDIDDKKQRLSRKGSMKATPLKIARCLRRMIALTESDDTLSQRTIAAKVAVEYSTYWRNCYRWMYE